MNNLIRIESISMLHSMFRIPPPKHPLVSVIDFSTFNNHEQESQHTDLHVSSSFYVITLKHLKSGSLQYGRKQIDFQEGSLFFSLPEQVSTIKNPVFEECRYNWGLYFHPDLIYGTPLFNKIAEYSFFRYTTNEALHLSEDEKVSLTAIIHTIETEVHRPIDKHSKNVLVSAIEFLLNHCNRFYDRQFITRASENNSVIDAIKTYLKNYFDSALLTEKGLPTALQCAEHVCLSPNYLSDLLRKETGKTTQEHIHFHLLEIAKDRLLGSNNSIKEIAYSLGFEHSQYFSSLFRKKVGLSPTEFRNLN